MSDQVADQCEHRNRRATQGDGTRERARSAGQPRANIGLKVGVAIGLVIILALGVVVTLQFAQLQSLRDPAVASSQLAADNQALIDEVGAIYLLPEEEATIATIDDAEKLSEQAFFARAQDGDRMLIFAGAQLAILYRPSAGQIVNAGPLVLNAAELAEQRAADAVNAEEAREGTE